MATIQLTTRILAPIQVCFDLARSIDLHKETTKETGENAIAGRTEGLIELNETETWRAKHLGIWQQLTSKITKMQKPDYFQDIQIKGAFKIIVHDHYFEEERGWTTMTDHFYFASPFGIVGRIFDKLFLKNYMKKFLLQRNAILKEYAECERKDIFLK